ncbi:MAG: hypothetical protein ACTIA3_04715 [Corynebacterium casei]|uniref:hypothetical protein n=1 Tax=Corynebacterium casei TaxID=160386 RepID=UPI003F93224A
MAKNTMLLRIEAKLRLITASEFHACIHDEAFRAQFLGHYQWAPDTPVIPELWNTTVDEVCEHIEWHCTEDTEFLVVPVLLKDPVKLACILVTDMFDVFEPDMTMDEVSEALGQTSDWAFAQEMDVRVQNELEINRLLEMV